MPRTISDQMAARKKAVPVVDPTGAAIGFLGTVVVSSQLEILDGLELSMALAGFSIVVFLSGASLLFTSN